MAETPGRTADAPHDSTVDPEEIARFSAMAAEWWDPRGKFKPLHRLNPVRIAYIRDILAARYGRDPKGAKPLDGLALLDIGCGGGLLCEPMTRLGAAVTGIDASETNIGVAATHAEEMGLGIDYRATTAEALLAEGTRFDAVLNMEVVEHVADVDAFMRASCDLVKPGGVMVVSTLNRTVKSLMLAKIGVEYVLRWLPRGTHDWRKFLKPAELTRAIRGGGMQVQEIVGVTYNPLTDAWATSKDLDVNYMLYAVKPDAP